MVCVIPPPVAVIVIVCVPSVALRPTVTFIVDVPDPGAAIDAGENVTEFELPSPLADNVIAESKLPDATVVMVAVPDELLATVIAVGDAETVNDAATVDVTVRFTVVVSVSPPPVPVIVIGYVPAAVVAATVNVTVELPDPGAAIVDGLNPTVTPVGAPEAVSATAELKPPETAVVIVDVPELPVATETAVGDAEMANAGVCVVVPVSVVISAGVGEPQPVTRS